MKRVNALLELYLRHFVSANQHDWAKLLDVAQFSYNLERREATSRSPFELIMGQQSLTPYTLFTSYTGRCPAVYKVAKSWHEQTDIARAHLDKATKQMKKWADSKRRHLEFNVGDMVLVKIVPAQHKSTRSLHKGLIQKYDGRQCVVQARVIFLVNLRIYEMLTSTFLYETISRVWILKSFTSATAL